MLTKTNTLSGYVYIATNPLHPDTPKIGYTEKHPSKRDEQLSKNTGVLEDYTNQWYVKVPNCKLAEALLHDAFNDCRKRPDKEFFTIDLVEAILKAEEVLLSFFKSFEDRYCKLEIRFIPIVHKSIGYSTQTEEDDIWNEDITDQISRQYHYKLASKVNSISLIHSPVRGKTWVEISVLDDDSEIVVKTNITSFRPNQLSLFDEWQGFPPNLPMATYVDSFFFSFVEIMFFISQKKSVKALEQILDEDLITIKDYKYFDRELKGSIIEILETIEKNSKKLKLKSKDKDLITEFINVVYDIPNVPNCGYSLNISLSEKGKAYHSNQYWSVVIDEYKFKVDKMNSMYDKEIGGDSYIVYLYVQYPGEYPVVEGYFGDWQNELLEILSGNYIGKLSVSITEGNEYS